MDSNTYVTSEMTSQTWVMSSKKENDLLRKLKTNFSSLHEIVKGKVHYGVKTGLTEAFIIDEATKNSLVAKDPKANEIIKPVLRGRDIRKWSGRESGQFLICTFPSLNINIDNYPSVKEHLLSFDIKRLEQTGKKGSRKKTGNKWFETQDSIDYWECFENPKIMYQVFQVRPCFIFDQSHHS